MDIDTIVSHMNDHHLEELRLLVRAYGGIECDAPKFCSVNEDGITVKANGRDVFVPFPSKTSEDAYVKAIVKLCMELKSSDSDVMNDMLDFIKGFDSLVLATLSDAGEVCSGYAPILKNDGHIYVYLSELGDHYKNIRANPNNIEVMFIEDESKANSPVMRRRARFRVSAEFVDRGDVFDEIYDGFVAKHGTGGGIGHMRSMTDFHLIRLDTGKGSYVKGFGQVYIVEGDSISRVRGGMPHRVVGR